MYQVDESFYNINNDIIFLQNGQFPETVALMTGVQWLKLDQTKLNEIPEEMGKLIKLVRNNSFTKLHLIFSNWRILQIY